ncbi:MAG: hypothetical protein QJR03_11735 [Sphaerobacter sp.]|nr:hypothetical protein [Sphaerobacter sp.]
MNVVDIVMTFVFLGLFSVGFFAGLGRVVAGLLALYAGLVAATIFARPLGGVLARALWPMSPWIGTVAAFVLVAVCVGGGILYVLLWSFRVGWLRSRSLGSYRGGVLGMVAGIVLSVVLSVGVVTSAVQVLDWSAYYLAQGGQGAWLVRHVNDSVIAASTRRLAPHLYAVVAAWTPGADASILKPN